MDNYTSPTTKCGLMTVLVLLQTAFSWLQSIVTRDHFLNISDVSVSIVSIRNSFHDLNYSNGSLRTTAAGAQGFVMVLRVGVITGLRPGIDHCQG